MTGMMVTGTTVGAPNIVSSCNGNGPERVFLYTPTTSGMHRISTEGSDFDTVLKVIQGNGCGGTELDCNDDAGSGNRWSQVAVNLTSGQPITIVVDSFSSMGGAFTLTVARGGIPDAGTDAGRVDAGTDAGRDAGRDAGVQDAGRRDTGIRTEICTDGMDNDGDNHTDCADNDCTTSANCMVGTCTMAPEGRNLGSMVGSSVATGTTVGLADNFNTLAGCTNSAPDIVFRWVAPGTQTYRIDTCGSAYDTMLWVTEGTCTATTPLQCSDDASETACSLQSAVELAATAGVVYHIGVDGYSSNAGMFQLNITAR